MDNYKIKVKDEAESKEAQELFFELGYEWRDSKKDITNLDVVFIYAKDGVLTAGFNDHNFAEAGHKELTLPQLRDLVVLKRNDINDANWETEGGDQIFKGSNDKSYIYRSDGWDELQRHEMRQAMWEKPKAIAQPQDPTLISGAEAKLAWANGVDIQIKNVNCVNWYDLDESKYNLDIFDNVRVDFRLKPQTIKLELELPKPFEPEEDCHVYILDDGKTDGYRRYSYEVHGDKGNTFIGIWRTEEEIKQVVEQLRKIRGTNS
ncbi:hypothetical protein [Acinetobacter nosocomialis]|uniref:hypothetical protein n=1 Tax=Acinetobacter nosocomialis TaxID=106654 RepID=UPI000DE7A20F|nr:hypothetical protein [Acinetobacter nosocomialis]SSV66046.1 Uncharacterised protein [Acinetobacter nosocomialis]